MERTPIDYLLRSARKKIRWYHGLLSIVGEENEWDAAQMVRDYPGVRKETEIGDAVSQYIMETDDVSLGDLDAFRESFYRQRPELHSVNFWWRLIEVSKTIREIKKGHEEVSGRATN